MCRHYSTWLRIDGRANLDSEGRANLELHEEYPEDPEATTYVHVYRRGRAIKPVCRIKSGRAWLDVVD